ncbi:MAG: A10/OS-D family protein, partial [Thermoplasmata archaeon]|nr:A10/OS-D family protein [Thermoplasmata archaeon]
VVPVMWQWFTDEQLVEMRAMFYNNLPPLLFENWMRWTLPALNPSELRVFVWGVANEPTPNRLADVLRIAKEYLHPDKWKQLEAKFDPSAP